MNSHTIGSNGTHVGKTRPKMSVDDVSREVSDLKGKALKAVKEGDETGYSRGWREAKEDTAKRSILETVENYAIGFIFGLATFAIVGTLYGMRFS